jgi:DNA-binding transcriptional LysR family regulator
LKFLFCDNETSLTFQLNSIVYLCSSAYHIFMNPILSSWDLVHAYLTVMREGSLSSAARKLRTSQPTVRRQIESLEAELAVPLFTHAPSGLIPTDMGLALRAQAEAAEAALGAFQRGSTGSAKGETGTVRITCSEVYGVEIMPHLLAPLMQKYQNLETELVLSNLPDDLLKREADIAVRLTEPKQDALIDKKVASVPLGFFASTDFLKHHSAPKSYKELAEDARFIGDDRRDAIQRGFAATKLPLPQNIVLRTDSDLAQLAAIRAGLGIGIAQVKLAKRSGLVRVLPELSIELACWIVMHEDLKHMRRVKLVFDYLVKALG